MRVNLKVPFAEKNHAKLLGARWDPAQKVWFLENVEDFTPFKRWMGHLLGKPKKARGGQRKQRGRRRVDHSPPVSTPRVDTSLTDCGCAHVAAWAHCHHTLPTESVCQQT